MAKIRLELTPAQEERLRKLASEAGLEPEEYVVKILRESLPPARSPAGDEGAAAHFEVATNLTTSSASEGNGGRIPDGYYAHEPESVAVFLTAHPHIRELLAEALPHIRKEFGGAREVSLQLVSDQAADEHVALLAHIMTSESVEEARASRDAFYRSWWNTAHARADAKLVFDIDFY